MAIDWEFEIVFFLVFTLIFIVGWYIWEEMKNGKTEIRELAICPQCKSRVPSESKFCLECGTNIQPNKKQHRL